MAILETEPEFTQSRTLAVSAYHTLLYNVFPPARSGGSARSVAVAFTSVSSGEGVTHVVGSVVQALRSCTGASAIRVDMELFKNQPLAKTSLTAPPEMPGRSGWASTWDQRRQLLQQLRLRAQYVVIDCPALSESSDCIGLAPMVDGIVLVVEADLTKKAQIRNAECRIEAAGGKILGVVLNKRRYPIPSSIYKML